MKDKIKGALFGLAIGDALGVPVEFKKREELETDPVRDMIGYGTWNQPPGTWSDDSSLAFCLAENLAEEYSPEMLSVKFIKWMNEGYWGARNSAFDVGITTRAAINRLMRGDIPALSGGIFEEENGNGSLMRILPLVFYIRNLSIEERFIIIKEVSSITHAHFRSVFACFIYMEMALNLLNKQQVAAAYINMRLSVKQFISEKEFEIKELKLFDRILESEVQNLKKTAVYSSGYALHTLEASLWCLLNTDNYANAVLMAVNLGEDTDTTGCVTGGLAGLLYGFENIPVHWATTLARKNDIQDLSEKLFKKLSI